MKISTPSPKQFCAFTLTLLFAMVAISEPSMAGRRRARGYARTGSPAGVFALYQNPSFGYGTCLAKPEESADTILQRNGISAVNATAQEKAALAKGISQVNKLLGGPIPKEWRVNYRWVQGSGPWNSELSRAGFVTIKRAPGSPKGTLTGRMMHELGHKFGHANGAQKYEEYARYTRGKRCYITTYCRKNINEEFAETFEAYVTQPDFLAKNCPDTFAFFQKQVFKNDKSALASCTKGPTGIASIEKQHAAAEATYDTASIEMDQNDAVDENSDDQGGESQDVQASELTG